MEKCLWKWKLKFANAGRRSELQTILNPTEFLSTMLGRENQRKTGHPPTGLGSLGGVRRGTARTRGTFSLFMGKFWVGEVHVIEP
jgi:hypothetical protein